MPGLGPLSFLPEAAKDIHALKYDQLIQKLAADSMQRQKNGRTRKHHRVMTLGSVVVGQHI
jgi:hypothetical protein